MSAGVTVADGPTCDQDAFGDAAPRAGVTVESQAGVISALLPAHSGKLQQRTGGIHQHASDGPPQMSRGAGLCRTEQGQVGSGWEGGVVLAVHCQCHAVWTVWRRSKGEGVGGVVGGRGRGSTFTPGPQNTRWRPVHFNEVAHPAHTQKKFLTSALMGSDTRVCAVVSLSIMSL